MSEYTDIIISSNNENLKALIQLRKNNSFRIRENNGVLLQNKHSFKAAYTLLSLNENGILNDHVRQAIAIAHRNSKAVAERSRHLNKIGLLNSQNIQAVATHSKQAESPVQCLARSGWRSDFNSRRPRTCAKAANNI
ncbi:hypothetical protein [Candidatus Coxiella mudrowiae]|uniref:Uncharacterized protein n=1 Tax=Candidatus Coxiella mudrowiae TaxID=2054173 RepID=A0ABN4HRM0_9COXI|nr:hypothetical protein [Candidatus Coxiella mudrowiae]AKQ33941.1 hypothetical protein CleRT_13940 [Candidatus Coxiella mudrowiae]